MMQSRLMSAIEACANVAVGYGIAVGTQIVVFPLFGIDVSLSDNLVIGLMFTAISLGRSFLLRRAFNRLWVVDLPIRGRQVRPD
ncbi:MAG: hypothetical protein NTZ54_05890 [Alphaproteobacteria bacterium]|nr:hypothetical protein [Alphaproteobacteria bacterium]